MPTNRTRRSRARHEIDDLKMRELHEGPGACLLAGKGYYMHPTFPGCVRGDENGFFWELRPDNKVAVIEAMRSDWLLNRDRVLETWTGEGEPWAAREFGG